MITDTIVSWWGGVVAWAIGLFSFPVVPEMFATLSGFIDSMSAWTANTGVWIPWGLLTTGIAAVGVCLIAAVSVKLVRVALSFLSAGGGSAA